MKKTISILLTMAMVLSLPLSVFAGSEGNVTVYGHIGTHGDPSDTYDITFSTDVYWWVTQAAPGKIVNGDSYGPNDAAVNFIKNNIATTEIVVSLNSFNLEDGDARNTDMQNNLELYLTGALAEDEMASENLNKGYDGITTYTKLLYGGDAKQWTYGFAGTYDAKLTKRYTPQYTMTLGFAFVEEAEL